VFCGTGFYTLFAQNNTPIAKSTRVSKTFWQVEKDY
jgi:hypothetical protein